MTRPKKAKGEVLEQLDRLLARGRSLLEEPAPDMLALAGHTLTRMEWAFEVSRVLPHMTRGIQVVADFARAGQISPVSGQSLEDEHKEFQRVLGAQLAALQQAVDRWRRSGTRPLV